jgi:ketosteroid isomerase-like protein
MTSRSPDVAEVVRSYYAAVGALGSTESDLLAVLAPDVQVHELPNALVPEGAVRDLEGTLAGFRSGKALLARQTFDVQEVLVDGERAAVRATWEGVVGVDAGGFTAGTRLVAHVAGWLTVRDGRVVDHETYDCYEPLARNVAP